ncbi:unnamed protein product, partial [Allacma fusca]
MKKQLPTINKENVIVFPAPRHDRAPFFVPHRIGSSMVPPEVRESFRQQSLRLLLKLHPSLLQELYSGNYVNRFKISLWFEEVQNEIMRSEYDLQGVVLQSSEDCYSITVPGLKEFHPPVRTGDIVNIYRSPNYKEMFEGPIKKIILD